MRVGAAAVGLVLVVGLFPVVSFAQPLADHYFRRGVDRAQRGDFAEAREDLERAAGFASEPELVFAVKSVQVDVDTALAFGDYARSLRRWGKTTEAAEVEDKMSRWLGSKPGRSEPSVFLGFSRSDLLHEYATYLRALGSTGEAKRIDDLADRYEQMQQAHFERLRERQR